MAQPISLFDLGFESDPRRVTLEHYVWEGIEQCRKRRSECELGLSSPDLAGAEAICERLAERWVVRLASGDYFRIVREPGDKVLITEGEPRHYMSTALPTLVPGPKPEREVLLLALYSEVAQSWRYLTDVRFKLIALIPAFSMLAWGQLISADTLRNGAGAALGLLLSLVALGVVEALWIYDKRNDELYDDLISRGRKIEEELRVDTGVFRGRRKPRSEEISHRPAVEALYKLALLGWTLLGVWFLLLFFGLGAARS